MDMNTEGFPKNVFFEYVTSYPLYKNVSTWLEKALEDQRLRYMLIGALNVIAPKGDDVFILVEDIITPEKLPEASFFVSENGNWHIGSKNGASTLNNDTLEKLNERKYSYFQTEDFFFALAKSKEKEKTYHLYVHKKCL